MTHEVELWVIVDEEGNYEVLKDLGDIDGAFLAGAQRTVHVTLKVPVPRAVEVVVEVPDLPDNVSTRCE